MYHSPWYDDTTYFWRDYPVTDYDKIFKYYYLVQYAFWLQQIFVLQIEAPRKDYRELVLHHINTLLLIFFSYGCNFTRVGNAVFVYMDLPDAILAVSVFFVCVRRKGSCVYVYLLVGQTSQLFAPWHGVQLYIRCHVGIMDVHARVLVWRRYLVYLHRT